MEHVAEAVDLGTDLNFVKQLCARCSCGHLTAVVHNFTDLDDEVQAHERQARRGALSLGGRGPSLLTTLKHYERMASHPACAAQERTQWEILAEEIRSRITQTTVDNAIGQESLLDILEET